MTKIWVDTTILRGSETCGMAEYTKNLIGILEKNSYKMECFYNPFLSFGFLSTKIYFLWLNTFFLLKTVIYRPDIIIFPSYIMPFFIRKKTRYYVVFYDIMLSREEYFGEKSTKTFKLYLYIAAKKATKIITISNTTKKLLNDEFKIPLENISIINCSLKKTLLCNNTNLDFSELEQKYNIKSKKYIFYIGGKFKHKNINSLIEAFNSLAEKYPGIKLVIAGYKGLINLDESNNKMLVKLNYIPDSDVIQLYRNSLFFVFPSLEEGFGMPIIEAQYLGCPVLCSDINVFKEVAGNGAEYCGTNSKSIAEKMEYLLNNNLRLEELVQLGKENIQRFQMATIVEQVKTNIF